MAPIPAAMCEMFPRGVRVSAVSVGYGLAYALFGGTAPLVAGGSSRARATTSCSRGTSPAQSVLSLLVR